MERRYYQVFVSSTYKDLVDEREQVTEQLLKSRCIPAGMELFTASGRPPWDVITSVIEITDYMILILGGRYGTVGSDGRSFTEREYDEAERRGIPVLAFLHQDIDSLPRRNVDVGEAAEKLAAFRAKVSDSERHTVQFWSDARDLAQKAGTAVREAIINEPRPGWVRGGSEPDQEGDRSAPTALTGDSRVDDLRETLHGPGGAARLERLISDAAHEVTSLPFVAGQAEYNNLTDVLVQFNERVVELEKAARPLVRLVATAARWGASELDRHWIDLIAEVGRWRRLNGFSVLVEQTRAPAMLLLTAGGLGACAGGRDDLVGLLLSDQIETNHPTQGIEVPAVTVLSAPLMYPYGWPSKELRQYFDTALGADDAWRGSVLDRAWERWQYLAAVARSYYREGAGMGVSGDWPYLRIEDRALDQHVTVVGRSLRKQVLAVGDGHPWLSNGLCARSATKFVETAEEFDSRYCEWGHRRDWDALPGMAGFLPSGPHYPGEPESTTYQ